MGLPVIEPILALAGGVGGAKLALGLANTLQPSQLVIIVNTGDDDQFHGLHVCPDLDTMMYTLAGLHNPEQGWGLSDESFKAMQMLDNYGVPIWFRLGDKDLATHIRRTQLLQEGWTLSEITQELCNQLGIKHILAPMSDNPIRTVLETSEGALTFQEYFVKRHCEPKPTAIRFEGSESAAPSAQFDSALRGARALVFCPSNPFLSVAPILSIKGIRQRIALFDKPRVVVSPIVAGNALRGPAAKMLLELGYPVSCLGVAQLYQGLCDIFIIDRADRAHADAIQSLGMEPKITDIVMTTEQDKTTLAEFILNCLET